MGFRGGSVGKECACQCRRLGFHPWVRKIPRRKWQPAPAFLPGESHGQRSLAGCSTGVAKSQTRPSTHVIMLVGLSTAHPALTPLSQVHSSLVLSRNMGMRNVSSPLRPFETKHKHIHHAPSLSDYHQSSKEKMICCLHAGVKEIWDRV